MEKYLIHEGVDLSVIMYSRNLFEYLVSAWGQYVKRGRGTLDLNEFLSGDVSCTHHRVVQWIELSKKYKFDLVIKNYSNHKSDLLESFLDTLFMSSSRRVLEELRMPPSRTVNRSLTLSEYKLQQEFNKHLAASDKHVSDALVNQLPHVRSEIPRIGLDVYHGVRQRLSPVIHEINESIAHEEKIQCETYEELESKFDALSDGRYWFSKEQIEVFVRSISGWIESLADRDFSQFDPEAYLELNPDVKRAGVDPFVHFVRFGIRENRRFKR